MWPASDAYAPVGAKYCLFPRVSVGNSVGEIRSEDLFATPAIQESPRHDHDERQRHRKRERERERERD